MKNETADIRRSRLNGQQCNAWCRTTTIDNLDRCCAQKRLLGGWQEAIPFFCPHDPRGFGVGGQNRCDIVQVGTGLALYKGEYQQVIYLVSQALILPTQNPGLLQWYPNYLLIYRYCSMRDCYR